MKLGSFQNLLLRNLRFDSEIHVKKIFFHFFTCQMRQTLPNSCTCMMRPANAIKTNRLYLSSRATYFREIPKGVNYACKYLYECSMCAHDYVSDCCEHLRCKARADKINTWSPRGKIYSGHSLLAAGC